MSRTEGEPAKRADGEQYRKHTAVRDGGLLICATYRVTATKVTEAEEVRILA